MGSAVVACALFVAACSGGSNSAEAGGKGDQSSSRAAAAFDRYSPFVAPAATSVAVEGREWRIAADASVAKAGPVDFTFANDGTVVHEMIVIRTDAPLGGIAVDPSTQRVDEKDPNIEVVDEIPEVEVGDTGVATIELEPGRYQLICNLAGHYSNGMHTALIVQ